MSSSEKARQTEFNTVIVTDDGEEIRLTKPYSVGVDCHSKFLQISVFVKREEKYYEYRKEFGTDYKEIKAAKSWIVNVVETHSIPKIIVDPEEFHYTIESTSTFHIPVVNIWSGKPSIVNPTLTGNSRRKTDVLDARMLASYDLTGLWRTSYIPSRDVWELRSLINESDYYHELAVKTANRIGNILLKFSVTVANKGSIASKPELRAAIEDLVSESPKFPHDDICPFPIPADTKVLLRNAFEQFDSFSDASNQYHNIAIEKAKSMFWETANTELPGTEMLNLLTSAPGVGMKTALIWLANIITVRRFPNEKALAAYAGLDPSLKTSAKHVTSTVKRGGNKQLHSSLCYAASGLMNKRTEPLGQWGYNIYASTGKWKKGTNAVGRKLAVALYHMQSKGEMFTYEKYSMVRIPKVIDISIEELTDLNPAFHRYIPALRKANILSTASLAKEYYYCTLERHERLGKKFFGLVKDFIGNQQFYIDAYEKYKKGENSNEQ